MVDGLITPSGTLSSLLVATMHDGATTPAKKQIPA